LEREQDVAKPRNPLDTSIQAESIKSAVKANKDSLEEVVSKIIAAKIFLGL
jgi:hypothetical protein